MTDFSRDWITRPALDRWALEEAGWHFHSETEVRCAKNRPAVRSVIMWRPRPPAGEMLAEAAE